MPTRSPKTRSSSRARPNFWVRAALLAAVWWALVGSEPASWLVGAPAVGASAWLSVWLPPRSSWRWSLLAFPEFLVLFARFSFVGGWDVARRVLDPRLPLRPAMVTLETRLPAGPARVFLLNTISLLPGTLAVDVRDAAITVHALDVERLEDGEVRHLEEVVARLFCLEPANKQDGHIAKRQVAAAESD